MLQNFIAALKTVILKSIYSGIYKCFKIWKCKEKEKRSNYCSVKSTNCNKTETPNKHYNETKQNHTKKTIIHRHYNKKTQT